MASIQLGTKEVGSIVKLYHNGTLRDFIVAHQGKPGQIYDDSCIGTWLFMKDICENSRWHTSSVNDYENSDLHRYLNSTWLNMFDEDLIQTIKQVKIPYRPGAGQSSKVKDGASGLSCKIFLLSAYEVGWTAATNLNAVADGVKLDYFIVGETESANAKRIGYLNDTASPWWLRTPSLRETTLAWSVNASGAPEFYYWSSGGGVRPVLILPSTLFVSDDGSIQINSAPFAPGWIDVPDMLIGNETATIRWGEATDPDGNLAGYVLERSVNGGAWEELYRGASKELTSGIVMGWNTVRFRVKAYDALGDESAYILTEVLTVINNTPPTAPSSIQAPDNIYGGSTITVTHGASTDADNNISGYTLEQSVDGGAWAEISTDTAFSHNVPITFGWNTIQFRVRAFDSYGAVSEYTVSPVISIINNRPPTISGEDRDLGALAEAFPRQTYVVDDADGGEVTVEVRLDGVLKNTFTAAPGAENPLEFTPEDWRKILNGPHTWTITAVDGLRAAATRTITFTKNVTTARFRVAAPFPADAMPEKCIMNFQGAHPDGSAITIEACNNGFDEAPAWEDITIKVLTGQKHFFSNTQKTAARWGIGVRVTLNRGSASGDCYVHSQRGNFA